MTSAAINRQYLMGAVMNSHPTVGGCIHNVVPFQDVVQIGDLSDLFERELARLPNVDTSGCVTVLKSNTDNVGVWLNNFCRFVLPVLANVYKPAQGAS